MVAMHARARAAAGVGTLFVRASEAARRLGVSTKALRVYEHAGLIRPRRSPAGWRLYGPRDLEDARGIIALRGLGVGLADIAALQSADAGARRHLLRAYQATLEARAGAVAAAAERVGGPSPGSEPESPPEAQLRPGRGAPGQVSLTLPRSFDLKRAHTVSNPRFSPHLEFVDMGGHGYATVRLTSDDMRTEFVCIPRPITRSDRPDGGPLRYRVVHTASLWKPGERPLLRQQVIEGDPGLSI